MQLGPEVLQVTKTNVHFELKILLCLEGERYQYFSNEFGIQCILYPLRSSDLKANLV